MDKPSDSPGSLQEALEWTRYLQELSPDSRDSILAEWSSLESGNTESPQNGSFSVWREFLVNLFGSTSTFSILSLQKHLLQSGIPRQTVERGLTTLSNMDWIQERWTDWSEVNDRAELRLRLYYLSRTESLSESLIPFVTFFFRASDPALYQQAAIGLGHHLPTRTELLDYFMSFVSERSISLDEPLPWTGQRTQRRVVLALSAMMGSHPGEPFPDDGVTVPDLPFVLPGRDDGDQTIPSDPADTAVFLSCLRLMSGSDHTRRRIQGRIRPVLRRVAQPLPYRRTRYIQEQWGHLLASECHRSARSESSDEFSEDILSITSTMYDSITRELQQGFEFGSLFRVWRIWDEFIRSLTLLPPDVLEQSVDRIEPSQSDSDTALMSLRLLTWLRREGGGHPTIYDRTMTRLKPRSTLPDVLEQALGCFGGVGRGDSNRLLDPGGDSRLESFAGLLGPLGERSLWRSREARTRALRAFLILDVLTHENLPGEQIGSLLERHGFKLFRGHEISGVPDSPTKQRWVRVLSRLQTWEQDGSESFLDTELIHEIGDPSLLLTMVPSHRPSDVLPVLADAFEHQIRISLRQDPELDPSRLLALVSIRDPHPSFFHHLAQVCAHRTYQDGMGNEVPLETWIRSIQYQMEEADRLPEREVDMERVAYLQEGLMDPGSHETPHSRRTRSFRKKMCDSGPMEGDPRDVLQRFLQLVGVPHEGRSPRPDTLLGMLRFLHPLDGAMLQSGYPARSTDTLRVVENRIGERVVRLETLVEELGPLNWVDIESLDDTVREIRNILQEWNETIVKTLPYTEERVFEILIRKLDGLLLDWVRKHEAIHEVLQSNPHNPTLDGGQRIRDLLEEIDRQWEGERRLELKSRSIEFFRRLLTRDETMVRSQEIEGSILESMGEDPWQSHRLLLDTALDQHGGKPGADYLEVLFESWCELLEAARTGGQTGRTIELLTGDRYRPLRNQEDAIPYLETGREWALDRYRLLMSRSISRELSALQDRSEPTLSGEVGRFLAHFSPVWLALLVGAILMLDFGDPWTTMAEKGDLQGILITFVLGMIATFLYVFMDLRTKEKRHGGTFTWTFWDSRFFRSSLFLGVCLIYTFLVVGFLWYLLSGTDQVVQGPYALGHVVVWAGFALFFGVFMGLIAQQTG